MTKLEKLKELGYKLREGFDYIYIKDIGYHTLKIYYDGKILDGYAELNYQYMYTVQDCHFKKAKKAIKKDLEILKEDSEE